MITDMIARTTKSSDKDIKIYDSEGLLLLIKKSGGKYWRLKYRINGKEKQLAIGVYPTVSLKQARIARDQAKQLIREGRDPSAESRVSKHTKNLVAEDSFKAIATEWFNIKMADKSASHRDRTWRALEKNLFPDIGFRPIAEISPPEILASLRKIEARGALDMARRTNQAAGQVFKYAIVTGRAVVDPSRDLSFALKTHVTQHYASITDPTKVRQLLLSIDSYKGSLVVEYALRLTPHLFVRPSELRKMEWSEIDWNRSLWVIPAEKMKMGQEHIVPLSSQVLGVLKKLLAVSSSNRYVFPSARRGGRPMSDNAVRTALRSMEYGSDDITPHGFRAMARTLLDEELGCRPEHIEAQLAHLPAGSLGAAYNRSKYLPDRVEMMQLWSDYLDNLKTDSRLQGGVSHESTI